jgi:hypothetical protein
MMNDLRRVVPLLVSLALAGPRLAAAADIFPPPITSAPILEIDPSVRSAAMGSAATADVWDVAPNHWANPALLGYAEGLRYEHSNVDYSGFAVLRVRRSTLGYGGLGFSSTGRPIEGLGKLEYELHASIGDLNLGDVERVKSWGVGASMGRLLEGLASATGHKAPHLTQHVDVAFGYGEKRIEEEISIDSPDASDRILQHAIARDRGVLVRTGIPVHAGTLGSARLEAAYGFSEINYNDPEFDTFGERNPTARDWRNGVALHAELSESGWSSRLPGWFAAGLAPTLSAGWAMDFVHTTRGVYSQPHDIDSWGAELGLANLIFGRIGRSGASNTDFVAHSWGIGVHVALGRYGGARWDRATVTREVLDDLTRDGWTVWVDPVRIYGAMR